ncbi:amidohydrolase [Kineococcus sp. TBRC 1896]|uniref:Amidohydrolase n=1 Tax=Kineococcus mangrovi TaxID=1660183 RepID=A0ABV4I1I7_9ACTN
MNPQLIVVADTVHTLDPARPRAQAVAVTDGTVTAVGDRADVAGWRGKGTEVVDLGGATLTPGLVDGHVHPVMGLVLTAGIDLTAVRSRADLVEALRAGAGDVRAGEWVRGWGLDPNAFEGAPVTSEPLVTALGPDALVYITLFDAHSALVSPRALERAGVTGPREFRSGAHVVVAGGRPTGHLLELEAMDLVSDLLPAEAPADRRRRFRDLLVSMAATGLVGANAMDFEGDSAELVRAVAQEEGGLPIRLRFAPFVMPHHGREHLDHVVDLQRSAGRRWAVDGAKFMIDGTIDGGTAWLEEADTHGESTAPFWPDPAEYSEAVRFLAAHDVPTVTHAIGDAGVRHVLRTVAGLPSGPGTGPRVPHRVEHVETLPDDLVGEFARLDVTASMQPTHCTHFTKADHSDNWSRRLGEVRADRAFRTRDLREAGARLALGSDWPIAPFDPRPIMADARLRRTAGRPEEEPVLPGQALTALMALEGYTTHAARAAGLGERAGTVRAGARADLVAFGLDPLRADPDEFAQSPVHLTVVDGSVVHRA